MDFDLTWRTKRATLMPVVHHECVRSPWPGMAGLYVSSIGMKIAIQFLAATVVFWLAGGISLRWESIELLSVCLFAMGTLTGIVGLAFVVSALLSGRCTRPTEREKS